MPRRFHAAGVGALALLAGCLHATKLPPDGGFDDGGAPDAGVLLCGDGNCDLSCPCPEASDYCDLTLAPCSGGAVQVTAGVCSNKSPCDGGSCAGQACATDRDCGLLTCDGGTCVEPSPGVGNANCPSVCELIVPPHSATPTCVCPSCADAQD